MTPFSASDAHHHVAVLHGRPNGSAQLQCEQQQRGHGAYFEFASSVAEAAPQRRWVERDKYDLFFWLHGFACLIGTSGCPDSLDMMVPLEKITSLFGDV